MKFLLTDNICRFFKMLLILSAMIFVFVQDRVVSDKEESFAWP